MHVVASRQLGHRRFLSKRLQGDLRLQLSWVTSVSFVAFQTPSPWSGSHLSKLSEIRGPPLLATPAAHADEGGMSFWLPGQLEV